MKRLYFMNEQGAVLVTSVGLVLVMMAMGICLSKITTNELETATLKARKESANYAAETGWMVATNWLQHESPPLTVNVSSDPADPNYNKYTELMLNIGELNNTSSVSGRPLMPTQYDMEIEYLGESKQKGYDAEKYNSYGYRVTSDGYVSRDSLKKNKVERRQAGRLTEVIVEFSRVVEK
ncbi:MAG: hypothetical protein V1753_10595 [Pseudomonadota bacterium]